MIRKRRPAREPAFGSDSFLDVIANLVGIVIILIVMIGGQVRALPEVASEEPSAALPQHTVEQESVLLPLEKEIATLQSRLLDMLRSLEEARQGRETLQQQSVQLSEKRFSALQRTSLEEKNIAEHQSTATTMESETQNLRQRIAQLKATLKELKTTAPPERRTLHFHYPISQPVSAGELIFECREGRVTFIDLQALLEQVRMVLPEKADELKSRWQLTDSVGPAGAFRLKYVLQRERSSPLDRAFGDLPPVEDRRFGYSLERWELVPAWTVRGEPLADALEEGSRFRQTVDALESEEIVLTFFVYPDSYELYRGLRDYLHDHRFLVAGRPLPANQPISGSRSGSVSRGQ